MLNPESRKRLTAVTEKLLGGEPENGELKRLIDEAIDAKPEQLQAAGQAVGEYLFKRYLELIQRCNSGETQEWLAQLLVDAAMNGSIVPCINSTRIKNHTKGKGN